MKMEEKKLSEDQKRLLILVSKFSKSSKNRDEEETWIKKIPLNSLVNRGITLKVFEEYDFAPQLVDYMGSVRYASISKEGEDDVADLREEGYLERLKLATSHHVYVSAYRITGKGEAAIQLFDKKYKEEIDEIVKCKKCSGEMKIESRVDSPYLICKRCGFEEKINIFKIDDVPYISKPFFSDIWLPTDSKK